MAEVWIPLISGLVGAFIGGASSVLVVLIQARRDEKRHLRELAMQLAAKEWERHAAVVDQQGGALGPMNFYLAGAMKMLRLIESKENITAEDLIRSAAESREILEAMIAADPNKPTWAK